MTTPNQSPGDEESPFEIGSDWSQNMTEESMKTWARGQVMPDYGQAYEEFFHLFDGFTSLGDLVGKIRDAIVKAEIPAPGPLLDIFDKMDGVDDEIVNLRGVLNQIRDIFNGLVVTPINNVVQAVKDWFGSLLNWQTKTTVEAADAENLIISNSVTEQGFTPFWISSKNSSDVTYPEMFTNMRYLLTGTTGDASSGTAHTHVLNSNGRADTSSMYSVNSGASSGGYIRASESVIRNSVGFYIHRNSGTISSGGVFLEIFEVEDDSTARKIYRSADFSGAIPVDSNTYVEVDFPEGVLLQKGRSYILSITNTTPIQLWMRGTDTGVYQFGWTNSATVAGQPTLSALQAARASNVRWMVIHTKDIEPDFLTFKDSFNRVALGRGWLRRSTTLGQVSLFLGTAVYGGVLDGAQAALYSKALNYDAHRVEATLSSNSSRRSGPVLCANSDMSEMTWLGVNTSDARIYTGSYASLTERAVISASGDGFWAIEWDDVNSRFNVYKDDTQVGSWTDTAGHSKHTTAHRFVGLRTTCSGLVKGASIDDWVGKDVTFS